jgi:microsomal dipeptidase-like Zn-dependent dipeptidase
MFVDLHAHYPMHLQPDGRQLAHESIHAWTKEWMRAHIVRWLSPTFNYEAPGGGASVTLEQMERGDVGVILSPLYSPFDEIDPTLAYGAAPRPGYFTDLLNQLTLVENNVQEEGGAARPATVAHSRAELEHALEARELVLVHAVEGGFQLGEDEHEIRRNVRTLADRGVSYITVAHLFWRGVATNSPALPFVPDWLYSLLFPQPQRVGLSPLGRALIHAMIDHGVLIDITHMSEQSIADTLDLLDDRDPARTVPVIATHMACRLPGFAYDYNLSDEVLRRVAERKGLLGLILCKHYISGGAKPGPASFDDSFVLLKRHIDHIAKVTGSYECISFGSDLDGYIKPALPGLVQLADMIELQRRLAVDYPGQVDAIMHGNALDVLKRAWLVPGPERHTRGGGDQPAASTAPEERCCDSRGALDVLAFVVGFVGYLYLAGVLIDRVRLSSARLPDYLVPDAFSVPRLVGDGLRQTFLAAAVLLLLCVLCYFASALRWEDNGPLWRELLQRRSRGQSRRAQPLDDVALRILAGFNTVTISALVALGLARFFNVILLDAAWLVALAWLLLFLLVYRLLCHKARALWSGRIGTVLWIVVAGLALFVSAPLGVLVLASAFVSTFGRLVARLQRPTTVRALVRSPLPWAVLVVTTMVALAYNAMPPESFPTVVLNTSEGERSGAYVGRTDAGVYLASCAVSETDATSSDEHVTFVPARSIKSADVTSRPYRFDSGKRPSLLTLAFHAVGGEGDTPTWFDADLRARAATCDGAGTEGVSNDQSLGAGVLKAPGPASGRAKDGEASIQEQAPRLIAELARRYQPTLLVTTADRNWPVSLGSVLAERGIDNSTACLVKARPAGKDCNPTPESLSPIGASAGDYLQLPVKLEDDSTPTGQFEAFMRGQEISPGLPSRWLTNPSVLQPWSTAQLYFYLSESFNQRLLDKRARNRLVPEAMIGLEYWFFYPYNYYPAAVRARLMGQTPLASEVLTVDRHQGDWEHVDVLLDRGTLQPRWLYLARHSYEGEFVRWGNVALEGDHPVVQAAYGGHPSYEPDCGPQTRTKAAGLTDWLVCGTGRLAFRGESTPLVDLARQAWACWPGFFGEASATEIAQAGRGETLRDKLRKVFFVAGPQAPLRQAENAEVCKHGQTSSEQKMLPRLQELQGKPPTP